MSYRNVRDPTGNIYCELSLVVDWRANISPIPWRKFDEKSFARQYEANAESVWSKRPFISNDEISSYQSKPHV